MRIGKVKTTSIGTNVLQKEQEFEWEISKFSSLRKDEGYYFKSPLFSFAGESWYLQMELIGPQKKNSAGIIGLYLIRKSPGPPFNMEYTLGIKTFNGKIDCGYQRQYVFKDVDMGYGTHCCITRYELYERKCDLMPYDDLTLFCTLKYPGHDEITTDLKDEVASKCAYSQTTSEKDDDVPPYQSKCMDKHTKCPECDDVIELKICDDHKYKIKEANSIVSKKLLDDLKELMLTGEYSDVVIKVKDEEFQLHKNILTVRNFYFRAMFKSGMKEHTSRVIPISDCEPDIFRTFIHYLYTGKVDKISAENVCDLYEAADKYQEDELKEECLCFMINIMSVDNVIDFILLSLKHDENKLLKSGTDFFCNKVKEIVRGVKWQTFMAEFPTQANELYIKALDNTDN